MKQVDDKYRPGNFVRYWDNDGINHRDYRFSFVFTIDIIVSFLKVKMIAIVLTM